MDVSSRNFGYLISYVIPGFIVVATLSSHSPSLGRLIGISTSTAPSVGGFLYVTVASVFAGMILSALRWLSLDTLHHAMGLRRPTWDFAVFQQKRSAFDALAYNHFRYYEFFGHTALALLAVAVSPRTLRIVLPFPAAVSYLLLTMLIALMFVASRDALRNYYGRTRELMGEREEPRIEFVEPIADD